jgi:hypothetical protein
LFHSGVFLFVDTNRFTPEKECFMQVQTLIYRLRLKCRSPPPFSKLLLTNLENLEVSMKATYLIWKTPPRNGANPDWQEISGKEFFALVRSLKNKDRYFIKLQSMDGDDADRAIFIEATEADYLDWKREKNHTDYLRKGRKMITVISYHSLESDDGECFGEELLPTPNGDVDAQYVNALLFEAALASLSDEEYRLVEFLYLSNRRRSVRDYEQVTGVSKSTISRRQKAVLEKLKNFFSN